MNVAVFVSTQGDVHFYKNIIAALEREGHQIFVLARDYLGTIDLLNELDIPFYQFSSPSNSESGKIMSIPEDVVNAFRYLKEKNADLTTGCGTYSTFTARLLKVPDITFNDCKCTTNAKLYALLKLTYQFTDIFVTPSSFKQDLGPKHLKLESYKELAYLHPNHYTPDPSVFDLLEIPRSRDYSVLSFNAYDCLYPGIRGLTDADKISLVEELIGYGEVFIFSDCDVPEAIQDYMLDVPKRRIHDVLGFASLLITDTQTSAIEAALLGTPAIRISPLAEDCDPVSVELEREFQLLFNVKTASEVASTAIQLVKNRRVTEDWQKKRCRLLDRKLDMTALLVSIIEEYSESVANLNADCVSWGIPILEFCSDGCQTVAEGWNRRVLPS